MENKCKSQKKQLYKVDPKVVILSENYFVVALNQLNYDLEKIMEITNIVDSLYEEEEPMKIERIASSIIDPIIR